MKTQLIEKYVMNVVNTREVAKEYNLRLNLIICIQNLLEKKSSCNKTLNFYSLSHGLILWDTTEYLY